MGQPNYTGEKTLSAESQASIAAAIGTLPKPSVSAPTIDSELLSNDTNTGPEFIGGADNPAAKTALLKEDQRDQEVAE